MPKPFVHTVFFTLNQPEDAPRLMQAAKEHLTGHEGTRSFAIGQRCREMSRDVNDVNYDVSLHMVFESKAAHDAYQPHARHDAFIAECSTLWSGVRVFDSTLDEE